MKKFRDWIFINCLTSLPNIHIYIYKFDKFNEGLKASLSRQTSFLHLEERSQQSFFQFFKAAPTFLFHEQPIELLRRRRHGTPPLNNKRVRWNSRRNDFTTDRRGKRNDQTAERTERKISWLKLPGSSSRSRKTNGPEDRVLSRG